MKKAQGFGCALRLLRRVVSGAALIAFLLALMLQSGLLPAVSAEPGAVMIIRINGSINPATDDYLKTSISRAQAEQAKLLVVELNTPGGLVTSMQSMVEVLLSAKVPTAVYVAPSGAGAVSAGAFITLAGNFAVMAPGTTIGAAHPVSSTGSDVGGVMGEKIENFAASLIKAIAEQRGRNAAWAEKAVRESVAITDREALDEKVIDFTASDLSKLLETLEGKTTVVGGQPVTLTKVSEAPRFEIGMSFKQEVVNILSDPTVAVLLGLVAMLGLGIELYHPGVVLPGIIGAICLILALTAGQILPINYGGLALLVLGAVFIGVELVMPSFAIWGVAGTVCFVLGSIYLIDSDLVWGEGFSVNKFLIGGFAALVAACFVGISYVVLRNRDLAVATGKEGLVGQHGVVVRKAFELNPLTGRSEGRVRVSGEYWNARSSGEAVLVEGSPVRVKAVEPGMLLIVEPLN